MDQYRALKYAHEKRRRLYRRRVYSCVLTACTIWAGVVLAQPSTGKLQVRPIEARKIVSGVTVTLDHSAPTFAAMEDTLQEPKPGHSLTSPVAEPLIAQRIEAGKVSGADFAASIAAENLAARKAAELPTETASNDKEKILELATQNLANRMASTSHKISLSDLKMSRDEFLRDLFFPLAERSKVSLARSQVMAQRVAQISPSPEIPAPKVEFKREMIHEPMAADVSLAVAQAPVQHQVFVRGPIEFTGGLALSEPTEKIVVYRDESGVAQESGSVWLKEGRYEIFVNESQGTLVAELQKANGEIVGRGDFSLENLPRAAEHGTHIDAVALRLAPVQQGLAGHTISANSYSADSSLTTQKIVPNARIDVDSLSESTFSGKDGGYSTENLFNGSSVLVRSSRSSYWGSLNFATAGRAADLVMFPRRMVAAIQQIVAPNTSLSSAAMIWGRVKSKGQPVSGAQVALVGEEDRAKPVYFNSMLLPDPTLSTTSENGLYAFLPVTNGAHFVQATNLGVSAEPRLSIAEEQNVSVTDVELVANNRGNVRVFDAFRTDWPLAADLVPVGAPQSGMSVPSNGAAQIQFASGEMPLVFDVDAGSKYQTVRMSVARENKDQAIYVPMISTDWLAAIAGRMRFSDVPDSGAVVGFVQGDLPFRASLGDHDIQAGTRVAYFDNQGNLLDTDYGTGGGGFLMLGVPKGYRAVVVQFSGTGKSLAAGVLVAPNVTNVITKTVR